MHTVTFLDDIVAIDDGAFYESEAMENMYFPKTTFSTAGPLKPTVQNSSFENIKTGGTVYVLPAQYDEAVL